jgi:hypothetical protein
MIVCYALLVPFVTQVPFQIRSSGLALPAIFVWKVRRSLSPAPPGPIETLSVQEERKIVTNVLVVTIVPGKPLWCTAVRMVSTALPALSTPQSVHLDTSAQRTQLIPTSVLRTTTVP